MIIATAPFLLHPSLISETRIQHRIISVNDNPLLEKDQDIAE